MPLFLRETKDPEFPKFLRREQYTVAAFRFLEFTQTLPMEHGDLQGKDKV